MEAISLWDLSSNTKRLNTVRYPSGSFRIIPWMTSSGTASNAGSSSSIGSAIVADSGSGFFRRRNLSESFTTILVSQAFSDPSPRQVNLSIDWNTLMNASCRMSLTSSSSGI